MSVYDNCLMGLRPTFDRFRPIWLAALRGGHYKQACYALRNEDNGFCCLGVACDLIAPSKWQPELVQSISGKAYKWGLLDPWSTTKRLAAAIGIPARAMDMLVSMNDHGSSFKEIADYIETGIP